MTHDPAQSTTTASGRAAAVQPPATELELRPFEPGDAEGFRTLNEAWITQYFRMEAPDHAALGDPVRNILQPGGHIFMALVDGAPIGCCALLAEEPGEFELAKMAVSEAYRGRGVGRRMLLYTIEQARALGAHRLHLGSNRRLANAVHLYESVGFRHLPPERARPSPYARADVFMEMELSRRP